jgi:hypothetical protein
MGYMKREWRVGVGGAKWKKAMIYVKTKDRTREIYNGLFERRLLQAR